MVSRPLCHTSPLSSCERLAATCMLLAETSGSDELVGSWSAQRAQIAALLFIPLWKPFALHSMFTDACCAVAIARHFSVRKLRRALRRLVNSAPFHEPSLLCFGLLFVRQRVGGGAPVAELAERLGAGVAAGRRGALAFDELVVRRVFGGRGVEAMARSMRVEMMRMLQTPPVCAFAVNLQVMGGGGVLQGVATVVWGADGAIGFCRRRREAASQEEGYLVLWMLPSAATLKLLSCTSLLMQGR